ncbi:MAG: hypothetical protein AAF376_07055 [Pseudomonadota bacterium]
MENEEYFDIHDAVSFLASNGVNTTANGLALKRSRGEGPKFIKPTPKTVVYRKSDLMRFIDPEAFQ